MSESPEKSGPSYGHPHFSTLMLVSGLTALVALSLIWNILNEKRHTRTLAIQAARAHFQKDQAFRRWATSHGGVYVPATRRTPANPHLSHIHERDLVTPSGRELTLMNPAYMLRQIMAEYPGLYGVRGRITSLKPLNPMNAPDAWESEALRAFETGKREVMTFTDIDGEPHLRLIRPMLVRKGCLKCHGHQGYEVGDVRGGVGVMVPMKHYLALASDIIRTMAWSHGFFWLLGLLLVAILHRRNQQRHLERMRADREIRRANASLEQRVKKRTAELAAINGELDAFAFSISHDLRAPLRAIDGFSQAVLEDYGQTLDDQGRLFLNRLREASQTLGRQIEGILTLSRSTRGEMRKVRVDISALAAEVVTLLRDAEPERQVDIHIEPDLVTRGDPRLIKILLENLIGNAWKFTARAADGARIWIESADHDGRTMFRVRDNGAGFDMTYAADLFKPFKRLHQAREFPGDGIGLATVERIVNRHGGRIEARGRPGEGATFDFILDTDPPTARDRTAAEES